jgi:DNA-binding NtrC family response regulator
MAVNALSKLRVLVVEDEPLIRWSVTQTLEGSGHTVLEAADARSAVDLLNEPGHPVDVVLLDYRLPDSNDLALLASVRRLAPDSAVILMTAYGTPDVVEGAFGLGVRNVLSKPFDLSALEGAILAACSGRSH